MKLTIALSHILLLLLASGPLCAQTPESHRCAESAHVFVQRFYDWYVPLAKRETKEPASNVAIRERGALFSKELLALLKEDAAAEAKANGYILGLDFDPFLNTQDASDRYDLGDITSKAGNCLVSIFGTRYGERSAHPDVIAEISCTNSRWIFINFHYPDTGENLIQILRALRHDRLKMNN